MREMHFMVLTGHLDEYTLPGLIRTLHAQSKTGRLQIDYAEAPAAFHFEQGRLVDARLGDLRGTEALLMALSLPGASFNFNPFIKPPERTFAEREQALIRELLDAPQARTLNAFPREASNVVPLPQLSDADARNARLALPAPVREEVVSEVKELLDTHARRFSRERAIYAVVIAFLVTFGVVMAFGGRFFTGGENTEPVEMAKVQSNSFATSGAETIVPGPAASTQPAKGVASEANAQRTQTAPAPAAKTKERDGRKAASASAQRSEEKKASAAPSEHVVSVLMQVERGRVLQARVQNSRPGMESYEALALRMARQRRYPESFNGQETLQLKVKP